ncbi:MAG: rhomboid family intramembrane serine protease [Chlorobi bacterium]|nr:rhomboid family intramembrane serine protease [Chlorobiota bacterium]
MNNLRYELKEMFKHGSMLTKLLFINIGVFAAGLILFLFVPVQYVAVPGNFKELIFRPWTLVTYMFIHQSLWHLLMNMLWLFWFGKLFLTYFNDKQLAAVYLSGGFAGAFFHIAVNMSAASGQQTTVIGASAAVMAIVFAVISYKPNYIIYLMFIGPVKIKYVGIFALLIDIAGLTGNLKGGGDGIAHLAHLGGAAFGLWFGIAAKNGKDITRGFNNMLNNLFSLFTEKRKTKINFKHDKFNRKMPDNDWDYNTRKAEIQKETDRILDKISKYGYDSLTKKEKEFLFRQKKN